MALLLPLTPFRKGPSFTGGPVADIAQRCAWRTLYVFKKKKKNSQHKRVVGTRRIQDNVSELAQMESKFAEGKTGPLPTLVSTVTSNLKMSTH